MPLYEYQCSKCNHTFELFRKMDNRHEPHDQPCPACNEVGGVEMAVSMPTFSYSAAKLPINTKLQEKLKQIHENTPGSQLHKASSITPI